jgi:hypothetical protein
MQDYNLVFEGPLPIAQEAKFLAEVERLEKCLVDSETRPSADELRQLGHELANALFPGAIEILVHTKVGDSMQVGVCCTDPGLKRIPWEYLVWPGERRAPSTNKSIARIVPVADGAEAKAVALGGRKLRVALIVAEPSEMAAVPWEQLERDLRQTFDAYFAARGVDSQVEMVLFGDVTRRELNIQLGQQPFDVIHFIGHGKANGLYMISRFDRKADLVPTSSVVGLFCRAGVKLILLSACSTGQWQRGDDIGPLAEELVTNEVSAVVGSQLPIPASAVAIFCAALYQQLLDTHDIDDAVAAGRRALEIELSSQTDGAAIEWGIPVLYRRPGRSKLFT